jgi:hypothetical protein
MCVQLRVEFTASVVAVCGDNPVGGPAIFIGPVEAYARCRVTFGFCERFPDRFIVSRDQALIPANQRLYGN